MHAYLDREVVENFFSSNLFDRRENLDHYRGLLGLDRAKPFECVGEIGESRLAFEICRRRGFTGRAIDEWARQEVPFDTTAALDRYLHVDEKASGLPEEIALGVLPQMHAAAAAARGWVDSWF